MALFSGSTVGGSMSLNTSCLLIVTSPCLGCTTHRFTTPGPATDIQKGGGIMQIILISVFLCSLLLHDSFISMALTCAGALLSELRLEMLNIYSTLKSIMLNVGRSTNHSNMFICNCHEPRNPHNIMQGHKEGGKSNTSELSCSSL